MVEAIANGIEDKLIDGLSFKLNPGASYVVDRRSVTFHPQGSNIYKTSAGTAKSDGQILQQRGRKQFDVQSAADGVPTRTRCTLVGSGTITAKQCYIKCVAPDGTLFYATRISNRFVWNGDTRYRYTIVDSTQLAFINLYNLGTSVAVVEGA